MYAVTVQLTKKAIYEDFNIIHGPQRLP